MELTEALCLIPLLLCSGRRLFEARVRRRLWTDRAYRIYAYVIYLLLRYFLDICIMMKLVVLVSLNWLCINDVIYDLGWLMYLNLDLRCFPYCMINVSSISYNVRINYSRHF